MERAVGRMIGLILFFLMVVGFGGSVLMVGLSVFICRDIRYGV